jgi:hydroxymethylbilane synthase
MTSGDRVQDRPLPAIGGKGLFTGEIETALRAGEIDLAVHSLKDLPVEDSEGLTLGAILARGEARDALISAHGQRLVELPAGAKVGTSSLRRAAQLRRLRHDLTVADIRGNVDTRVRKMQEGSYDAIVLAGAGLARLGLEHLVSEWFDLETMLPAPGQGAMAVQCRADDARVLEYLAAIHDPITADAVAAERAFLAALGGGCSAPVAAYALHEAGRWQLQGLVASVGGDRAVAVRGEGADALALARALAEQAMGQGAGAILAQPGGAAPGATTGKPLAGKRIVVTRSAEQGADLAALLAAQGAFPIPVPVLRIVALEDLTALHTAQDTLASYAWVIFTSVNGVRIFFGELARRGGSWPDGVCAAAVGPATAEALAAQGVEATVVPRRFDGAALAGALGEHEDLTGQRILLPRAEIADGELPTRFTAAGAEVHEVPIYHTLPAPIEAEAAAAMAEGCDAITFASSSAVGYFLDDLATKPEVAAKLRGAVVACIGPKTAETAAARGWPATIVAEEATAAGLVAALAAYFERRPA